jgi:hypothetical protein
MKRREFLAGSIAVSAISIVGVPCAKALNSALDNPAFHLKHALDDCGVMILPAEPKMKEGHRVGSIFSNGGVVHQLHIDNMGDKFTEDHIDALADAISQRGRQISFANLLLPNGLQAVSYEHGNVLLRNIIYYNPQIFHDDFYADKIISRLDALFVVKG